ncbi:RecQ-mediated genome instability protein 1 [Abeliophyllum distichum]|uniref:RecQ-mediated genome instability protein 1 n=1 Tax=Abeliophyllum distichum TaxID=126358 RepID=A0ABD1RUW0_9LAMI
MSRRRLRVVCSSDEEEEPPPPPQEQSLEDPGDDIIDDIEVELQTVTLNSSNPTPNSNVSATSTHNLPPEPIPLNISDDEPSTTNYNNNNRNYDSNSRNSNYFVVSDSPVNRVLEGLGLRLKEVWLDSCLGALETSIQGFPGFDDSVKAKLCFEQFLYSDMNYCGAGVLPPDVHTLHLVDLKGPFVLQVDEIVNISCPIRGRYQNAAPGMKRCLKLSMTDGVQRVFGMEYRPIKDLEVLAPAGLKVAICNVNVRHGLLMLVPEVLNILGGMVEELDAARQRLVNEVNKPPRGKRTRTGVVPPLATRATAAAWPPLSVNDPVPIDGSAMESPVPLQATRQGFTSGVSANDNQREDFPVSASRNNAETSSSSAGTAFSNPANGRSTQGFAVPVSRNNAEPNILSAVQPPDRFAVPGHIDKPATENMTPTQAMKHGTVQGIPANDITREDFTIPITRDDAKPNASSSVAMNVDEISAVDRLDHPFILSGDKEIPFTYLASLSAKWAAMEVKASSVRGKIKCFVTAVKAFQYKQRATYELRVYIDDGSLISEILLDHNLVQNGIGHSPEDVTSALTSSDTQCVSGMRKILKQFEKFLVNFEGTILVEINEASPVPVAIEMNQGCPESDALLLLKRLKPSSPAQSQQNSYMDLIVLSP